MNQPVPTPGIFKISDFDKYLIGRGMKPDNNKISKKEV